jgi:hypothetical protein
MELDELKTLLDKTAAGPIAANQKIADIITLDSLGPLAQLKKKIKFILYLLPITMLLFAGILASVIGMDELKNIPVIWILVIFFVKLVLSLLNYYTIIRIQKLNGNIRDTLVKKVQLLKLRYKWYFIVNAALFLLMPVFIELDINFAPHGYFHGLGEKINPFIRMAWYLVVFIPILVIKNESQKQNYGRYLDKLNALLKQMG